MESTSTTETNGPIEFIHWHSQQWSIVRAAARSTRPLSSRMHRLLRVECTSSLILNPLRHFPSCLRALHKRKKRPRPPPRTQSTATCVLNSTPGVEPGEEIEEVFDGDAAIMRAGAASVVNIGARDSSA